LLDKVIELDFDGPQGKQAKQIGMAGTAGIFLILVTGICCLIKKLKKRNNNQVQVLAEDTDLPQLDGVKQIPMNSVYKSKEEMSSVDIEDAKLEQAELATIEPKNEEEYNSKTKLQSQ